MKLNVFATVFICVTVLTACGARPSDRIATQSNSAQEVKEKKEKNDKNETKKVNMKEKAEEVNAEVVPVNGVLLQLPSNQEWKAVTESVDPETGKQTKHVKLKKVKRGNASAQAEELKATKSIVLPSGFELELYLITDNGKAKWLVEPSAGVLENLPGNDNVMIYQDKDIYLIDPASSTYSELLLDNVAGYDKHALEQVVLEDVAFTWGSNLTVDPSGHYAVYYTNRNIYRDGDSNGQLWVKDMQSGDESMLFKDNANIMGWSGNNEILIRTDDAIVALNVVTRQTRTVEPLDETNKYDYKSPWLIAKSRTELTITDLSTFATKVFPFDASSRISTVSANDSGQFAVAYYPVASASAMSVEVIDFQTEQRAVFDSIDPNESFDGLYWDHGDLYVRTYMAAIDERKTYVLSTNTISEVIAP
ncbi:hypothetical protein [Paenibacillus kobensis]|uniref:hypothetical protein n=1 Tax=Paenibacillus kobensis TaxID=59841 RepID=UPI000FDC6288|nr:hypothetical protein [Paenibacillus kobensis]